MILFELKNYILKNPYSTAAQMAKAFQLSEDGIQAMLSIWQKQGVLKSIHKDTIQYVWAKDNEIGLMLQLN